MKETADRMAALGNETRLAIYRLLVRAGHRGRNVSDIREHLDMPASTLSHHLHKLIRVGLVQQERHGTTLICRADYSVMASTFEVFARECCVDEEVDEEDADEDADEDAACCSPPPSTQTTDTPNKPHEAAPSAQGK